MSAAAIVDSPLLSGLGGRGPGEGRRDQADRGNLVAVTITVTQILAALRLGDTDAEVEQGTRLLAYATTAVEKHAPGEDVPVTIQNEAVVRLSGYLFDQPTAGRGAAYANALRNSGAAAILSPYRIHRAGSVEGSVAAQADGSTIELTLPANTVGMGDGVLDGGRFSADGTTLTLTLTEGGDVIVNVPELLRMAGVTEMRVNELITAADHASQSDFDDLTARVSALEGTGPHMLTRYAALRAAGSVAGDFTEADFLAGTMSATDEILTPDSDVDAILGFAVPSSEGSLTGVEIVGDPLAQQLRDDYAPGVGASVVELDVGGSAQYIYASTFLELSRGLGSISYRLTQG